MSGSISLVDLPARHARIAAKAEPAVAAVLRSGRYVGGPVVTEVEGALASLHGRAEAVGVASGTDALILGLLALGVSPGDEVLRGVKESPKGAQRKPKGDKKRQKRAQRQPKTAKESEKGGQREPKGRQNMSQNDEKSRFFCKAAWKAKKRGPRFRIIKVWWLFGVIFGPFWESNSVIFVLFLGFVFIDF